MKLLIVEDNQLLAASLRNLLKSSFIVDIAHNGTQSLELAATTQYGAIILDLGLPDMHGFQVCQRMRTQGVTAPILVATGEKDPGQMVQLLDAGADDYVTKPYNMGVLQARLRALMRRNQNITTQNSMVVGDLIINTDRRQVSRGGMDIPLRKKEFDILDYLVQNKGRAVTRAMILNHVWEAGKESWNNTVDVHIKYLRDKIDKPFEKQLIKTAYGVGYLVDDN